MSYDAEDYAASVVIPMCLCPPDCPKCAEGVKHDCEDEIE